MNMRSTSCSFSEQLHDVTSQFDSWNDCDQTTALLTLLKRLRPSHARFLCRIVEKSLDSDQALSRSDTQANNPSYLAELLKQSDTAGALNSLIAHIPLLRQSSHEAKFIYLQLAKRLTQAAYDAGRQTDQCRQLGMYLLTHPALTESEIQDVSIWFAELEQKQKMAQRAVAAQNNRNNIMQSSISTQHNGIWPPSTLRDSGVVLNSFSESASSKGLNPPRPLGCSISTGTDLSSLSAKKIMLCSTNSGPPGLSSVGCYNGGATDKSKSHRLLHRTESLIPPNLQKTQDEYSQHAQLSPQSSASSNGDEPKNSFADPQSGMRDVPGWLKQLRLHKYLKHFQQMSYEEMLAITPEYLEDQNITKGARDKIMLNIDKLKTRSATLVELDKILTENGDIKHALAELKSIVCMPMKANYNVSNKEDDIPSAIIRFMGKICSRLSWDLSEENFTNFLQLTEKVTKHPAFTEHLQQLNLYQSQILSKRNALCHRATRTFPPPGQQHLAGGSRRPGNIPKRAQSFCKQVLKPNLSMPPDLLVSPPITSSNSALNSLSSYHNHLAIDNLRKQQLTRTHSAPTKRESEPEINARLDSLCLSMTKSALD